MKPVAHDLEEQDMDNFTNFDTLGFCPENHDCNEKHKNFNPKIHKAKDKTVIKQRLSGNEPLISMIT